MSDTTIVLRDGLELRPDQKKVVWRGDDVGLPNMQFQILEFLVRNRSTPQNKQAILDHLYGGDRNRHPTPKIVAVLVHHLRERLKDAGVPRILYTRPEAKGARGYYIS